MKNFFMVVVLLITSRSFAQQNSLPIPGNSSGGGGESVINYCHMVGFPLTGVKACIRPEGVRLEWNPIPLGAAIGYDIYECNADQAIEMATRVDYAKGSSTSSYVVSNPKLTQNTRYCVIPVSPDYCHRFQISVPVAPVNCGQE